MQVFKVLRYHGVVYRGYRIDQFGNLERWLVTKKRWKQQRAYFDTPGGYRRYYVKGRKITASAAVQESHHGICMAGLVAAHRAGTTRADISLESCTIKTHRGNRLDRLRDLTHSTRNTTPGKLRGCRQQIVQMYRGGHSKRAIAGYFDCTPQAIIYQLREAGAA